MRGYFHGAWVVLVLLATSGCSGTDDQTAPEALRDPDERAVTHYLEERGILDFEIRRSSDEVIIERDGAASFSDLLSFAREANGDLGTEGYWYRDGSVVRGVYVHGYQPRVERGVRFVYTSDINTSWRTAFAAAAAVWRGGAPCVALNDPAGTFTITISKANVGDSGTLALASYPFLTLLGTLRIMAPGPTIKLNSNRPGIDNEAADFKKHIAIHELGHTLGFIHPEGGGTAARIAGTSGGTSYPTVMHANPVYPGDQALTADDIASRNRMFPCN